MCQSDRRPSALEYIHIGDYNPSQSVSPYDQELSLKITHHEDPVLELDIPELERRKKQWNVCVLDEILSKHIRISLGPCYLFMQSCTLGKSGVPILGTLSGK